MCQYLYLIIQFLERSKCDIPDEHCHILSIDKYLTMTTPLKITITLWNSLTSYYFSFYFHLLTI